MIDATDKKILNILQENARTPNVEIAKRVGMAPSGVLERIRKLESRGVILGYESRLDPLELGLELTTFILVRTEEPVGSCEIGRKLASIPEVQEIHYIAGDYCYIMKVRVPDSRALGDLLKKFGSFKEVSDTRTTLVLGSIKDSLVLPLDDVRVNSQNRKPA
jgi:Lrp/AsnC family leucine-responsive transcriptional regulator